MTHNKFENNTDLFPTLSFLNTASPNIFTSVEGLSGCEFVTAAVWTCAVQTANSRHKNQPLNKK